MSEIDGRRKRSEDSRARIVAAMLELARDTGASPSAEQVAERAGVGLRSVFRHFRDMESLYREITEVVEANLRQVAARPFVGATWRERLDELIARRGEAFEFAAPYRKASDSKRQGSPELQMRHNRMISVLRQLLLAQLPADVAADAMLVESLDLMLSFETWQRLRADQGLTPDEAQQVLAWSVRRLLGERSA